MWLIDLTGSKLTPAYLLIGGGLLTLLTLLTVRETSRSELAQ